MQIGCGCVAGRLRYVAGGSLPKLALFFRRHVRARGAPIGSGEGLEVHERPVDSQLIWRVLVSEELELGGSLSLHNAPVLTPREEKQASFFVCQPVAGLAKNIRV